MNIDIKTMKRVALSDLKFGDTFISGGNYYIKTDDSYHGLKDTTACVELKKGTLVACNDYSEVIPISLTVIETPKPEG